MLDYKIRELKAQIDPKTADIASMKTQTQAMEDELNDYKRDLASIAAVAFSAIRSCTGKNKQLVPGSARQV